MRSREITTEHVGRFYKLSNDMNPRINIPNTDYMCNKPRGFLIEQFGRARRGMKHFCK